MTDARGEASSSPIEGVETHPFLRSTVNFYSHKLNIVFDLMEYFSPPKISPIISPLFIYLFISKLWIL